MAPEVVTKHRPPCGPTRAGGREGRRQTGQEADEGMSSDGRGCKNSLGGTIRSAVALCECRRARDTVSLAARVVGGYEYGPLRTRDPQSTADALHRLYQLGKVEGQSHSGDVWILRGWRMPLGGNDPHSARANAFRSSMGSFATSASQRLPGEMSSERQPRVQPWEQAVMGAKWRACILLLLHSPRRSDATSKGTDTLRGQSAER